MVGKPYAQPLNRTQNTSPQRVPTERFQVPAQHYQTFVMVTDTRFMLSQTMLWKAALFSSLV